MVWLGYRRVSRVGDRGEKLISPELQAERIRAYADGRGLALEMLAPELDVSGGKVDRPILGEAIARIEAGGASGLIVAQLDRLSRAGIVDTHHLIQRIEGAGGKVIAVAESFDDSTPEGRMGRNVMLALGEMQLDRYRAQFAAAKEQAVRRGIWPVPQPPRGYLIGDDRHLVPDPDVAPLIVKAFEARAARKSFPYIATEILGCGPSGSQKAIRNRAYLGEINLGELRNPAAHEPLVSRALWESAQIKHPRPARSKWPRGLLAGLCRCESCGCLMPQSTMTTGWRGYRCRPLKAGGKCPAPAMVSGLQIEPFVEAVVLEHAADISFAPTPEDTVVLERALGDAEAELEAYQRAVKVAELGAEVFASGMRERIDQVEETRRALAKARPPDAIVPMSSVGELWPTLGVEQRGHLLSGALSAVVVRRGRGAIASRVRILDGEGSPVEVSEGVRQGLGQAGA